MSAPDKAMLPAGGAPDANSAEMRGHAVRGAAWMMALRGAVRLLSIASTAVLARVLTPADFGLFAMAMLVLAVITVFGDGGQDLALIRMGRPSRDYLDSAWTIKVIIAIVLFSCAIAAAPLAGTYFNSANVARVVDFTSLWILLDGFTNIGTIYFRIDLDFAKEFRYSIYRKLCDVVLVVSCALVLRNFWALAIAVVLSKVVDVILSYAMQPFRPRFRLNRVREIWSFSAWMLLVRLGAQLVAKTDQYVVGTTNRAAVMGAYNVAADLAVTPTIDLVMPVMRAMFPVYSRLLGDPHRLRSAALLVIGATASVCLATGLGAAGIARELTLVLLGHQWAQATPLVFWLGIGAIPAGMNVCIYSIMTVTNNVRLTTITVWARFVLLVPTLLIAARWGGAPGIAAAQAGLGFVAMAADFFMLRLAIKFSAADLFGCFYRPLAAGLAMVFVLHLIDQTTHLPLFAAMMFKIVCGAIAYLGSLTIVWFLAGKSDGIEALVFGLGAKIIGRRAPERG